MADVTAVEVRQSTIEAVAERLRELKPQREDTDKYTVFRLAPGKDAEYAFAVWVYEDGEPQLSASLTSSHDEHSFWYLPFELPDWPNAAARTEDFLAALHTVVSKRTRITQTRRLLSWSFDCEFDDCGVWKSIGGISFLRFSNFVIPKIEGRRRRYSSPSLE
jgi:hypothetical protein